MVRNLILFSSNEMVLNFVASCSLIRVILKLYPKINNDVESL